MSDNIVENIIDIKSIAHKLGLDELKFEAPENSRVGDAPLLDNGLNLLYAPPAYGKSYTAIAIAGESDLPSVFIDLESNGQLFVNHCKKNNVAYVYAGSAKDIMSSVKEIVKEIKEQHTKALIIIDSYSDLFPDDEGVMPKDAQKQLGDMHKFFMRDVELPILILDHGTEKDHPSGTGKTFKIEGNKSGKFKKTVAVLRLEKIDGDIENGTFVKVERSRNHDKLPVGHTRHYRRSNYLAEKLRSLIAAGKLNEEFISSDLENCLSGNDRKLWRDSRDEIATSRKDGKKILWKLKIDLPDIKGNKV